MRTLFEEGFGVIGGYAGTLFGANVVGLGVVAILGLGPFGAFLAVFICATAIGMGSNALFIDQPDFLGIGTICLYMLNVWFPDDIQNIPPQIQLFRNIDSLWFL
jgi:hypothetical protein